MIASALSDPVGKIAKMDSGKIEVLCTAAVYGGNASGKSNFLGALELMSEVILYSHSKGEGREGIPFYPFRLDSKSKKKPMYFDVDLYINDTRYHYEFSMNRKVFLHEILHSYPKGKRKLLFDRNAKRKPEFRFGKGLGGNNRTIQKLTRPNSLYLSAAAQNNHPLLSPIQEWFRSRITFFDDSFREEDATLKKIITNELPQAEVVRFLKFADLGLCGLEFSEIEKKSDKKSSEFSEEFKKLIEKHIGKELSGELDFDQPLKRIRLVHSGEGNKRTAFNLNDESHGTRALFALIGPILDAVKSGGVIVVDELENGMHPLMARELIKIFNSEASNPRNAQLIFSTHSTNLLREGLLRRDQIWFAEKDRNGVTHLYPLTDFKPRKFENIERGYLQGRYGAVPFLGDLNFLIARDRTNGAKKVEPQG